MPETRKRILSEFREKRTRILISCRCLDEGMDVPDASAGIVLSSTSTTRQRLQRLGRILRKSANKDIAALYYIYVGDSLESPAYLQGQDLVDDIRQKPLPTSPRSDSVQLHELGIEHPSACLHEPESMDITDQGAKTPFHHQASLHEQVHTSEAFIRYLPAEDAFIHPAYEELAANTLHEIIQEKNPSDDMIRELRTCLQEGLIRPDWHTSSEYCIKKYHQATGRHMKNYWLCMEKLCRNQS